jgi:hypothetical protein
MMGLAMNDAGSGVERLRARQRRRWRIVAVLAAMLVADAIFLWATGVTTRDLRQPPPAMADGMATGILLGAAIGYRFICRMKDEHDVRARRLAAQAAFMTFLIAYPVWACFGIGGVLPPVNGAVLYGGVLTVYLATFLWWKYR